MEPTNQLRTRAEVEAMVKDMIKDLAPSSDYEDILEALTTLSLSYDELIADLRQRFPSLSDEAIQDYACNDLILCYDFAKEQTDLLQWQAREIVDRYTALNGAGQGRNLTDNNH